MDQTISTPSLFSLESFPFPELFTEGEYPWETIKKIGPFLQSLFSEGRLKGNYAENVYVSKNAQVDTTARILGPTYIGDDVRVGFNAYVHEFVIADTHAVIGTHCEVKNAILMNTCKVAHFNYVSDSILGNEVRIGAGALIVNKRVDRETVKIKLSSGERVDTGLTKFGALLGDRTRIGANAVINPGTIIGKRSLVYPLESVFGRYGDDEIIKRERV